MYWCKQMVRFSLLSPNKRLTMAHCRSKCDDVNQALVTARLCRYTVYKDDSDIKQNHTRQPTVFSLLFYTPIQFFTSTTSIM